MLAGSDLRHIGRSARALCGRSGCWLSEPQRILMRACRVGADPDCAAKELQAAHRGFDLGGSQASILAAAARP